MSRPFCSESSSSALHQSLHKTGRNRCSKVTGTISEWLLGAVKRNTRSKLRIDINRRFTSLRPAPVVAVRRLWWRRIELPVAKRVRFSRSSTRVLSWGQKEATITVVFDEPAYAEVQLKVSGFIRSDVVFTPGSVNFSDIQKGEEAVTPIEISYAGREDWAITDVRSRNSHLSVELAETHRGQGGVQYQMLSLIHI